MKIVARLVLLLLVTPVVAHAQSAWGVSITPEGAIVFCDNSRGRVWLVAAGSKTELFNNTYCHAVITSDEGVTYGEALLPTSSTTFSRALWRLGPGGQPQFSAGPSAAPDSSEWLIRDHEGRVYAWTGEARGSRYSLITRRLPNGSAGPFVGDLWGQRDGLGTGAALGRVAGMAIAPDDTLIIADSGNIRRIDMTGRVRTEARGVVSDLTGTGAREIGLWNHDMGVAADLDGSAIVVDPHAGHIVRVDRAGRVNIVWQSGGIADWLSGSRWGWRPAGVARTADAYYVLEDWPLPRVVADLVGSPRVFRVALDGSITRVASVTDWTVRGSALLLVLVIWSVWRTWRRSWRARRAAPSPARE